MKKAKLLTVAILVIITLSMTVLQVGASREMFIVDVDINDIDYSHCANISSERASQIVHSMFGNANDTYMMYSRSIWCIFGHDLSRGVIVTTQHRAYSTVPRCRQTMNSVEFCNRCSHFVVLNESITRIGCC